MNRSKQEMGNRRIHEESCIAMMLCEIATVVHSDRMPHCAVQATFVSLLQCEFAANVPGQRIARQSRPLGKSPRKLDSARNEMASLIAWRPNRGAIGLSALWPKEDNLDSNGEFYVFFMKLVARARVCPFRFAHEAPDVPPEHVDVR